jgi:hypothetical protein
MLVLRDRYDWITWAANPLLVLVGVGGIVVAVVTLLKIERQTKATEDAVRIAQATLVSTFRPKLIVRGLNFRRDKALADEAGACRLGYELVNIGGTIAHITQCEACVHYFAGRCGDKDIGSASNTADSKEMFSLKPGEYKEEFVELGIEVTARLDYLETSLVEGVTNSLLVGEMYLTGRIEYRDDTGSIRRTGFHRSYNQETKRFSIVPDPDYEYSD